MINAKSPPKAASTSVRKIGVRTEHVRGRIAENQEYESLLERDFLTLLRMDFEVASFASQPLGISYFHAGRQRTYTPDALVHYKPNSLGQVRRPRLVEVKPSAFAENPTEQMKAKFAAATRYCELESWEFIVLTEAHIRTPRLANVNFLLRYLKRECEPTHKAMLMEQLRLWNGCATAQALLAGVYRSRVSQAELLPDLWTLVATGALYIDLDLPLTMNTEIWET